MKLKNTKKELESKIEELKNDNSNQKNTYEKRIDDLQNLMTSNPNTQPLVVKESIDRVGRIFEDLSTLYEKENEDEEKLDFYAKKISELEEKNQKLVQNYELKIQEMNSLNESEIEQIKTSQELAQSQIRDQTEDKLKDRIEELEKIVAQNSIKLEEQKMQSYSAEKQNEILQDKQSEISELKKSVTTLNSTLFMERQENADLKSTMKDMMKKIEWMNIHSNKV